MSDQPALPDYSGAADSHLRRLISDSSLWGRANVEARPRTWRRPPPAAPARPPAAPASVPPPTDSPGLPTEQPQRRRRHLAHHFASPEQQLDTAKLGMWIFIATEILMFSGLFCLYAVFRNLYPAAFKYGAGFMDINWGLINTVVLLLSSLTMAIAVHCARTSNRQLLMLFLTLTIMCGVTFLGVKVIEYRHKIEAGLLWGRSFEPRHVTQPQAPSAMSSGGAALSPVAAAGGATDAAHGRTLYLSTCAACHGPGGDGMERLGLPLRSSEFVKSSSDASLVDFIKTGRQPGDAQSKMNALMPPRGGNPFLTDAELSQIAAYVRSLAGADAASAAAGGAMVAATTSRADAQALVPRWISMRQSPKDAGLSPQFLASHTHWTPPEPKQPGEPPAHAAKYFGIYFLMTGLHGVHIIIGLGIVGWLLWRSSRWQFSARYYTPVEIGGLYWHLVDLIWIFIFPLLYLVH